VVASAKCFQFSEKCCLKKNGSTSKKCLLLLTRILPPCALIKEFFLYSRVLLIYAVVSSGRFKEIISM
jgi:hypothetical protein